MPQTVSSTVEPPLSENFFVNLLKMLAGAGGGAAGAKGVTG
jgi:hypothetical protein